MGAWMLVKNSLPFFVVTAALGEVSQGKSLECGAVSAVGRKTTEKERRGRMRMMMYANSIENGGG